MVNNKIVGIVIPVYNCEKYLEKCLESVIHQTYKNIKIILINDGSTDCSLKILKQYVAKDNRIIIVDQANSGQGIARNVGIDLFSNRIKLKFKHCENNLSVFETSFTNNYHIKSVYIKKNQFTEYFNLNIDYIIFLDSDDFWELNCIEECVKHMNKADIVWFNYNFYKEIDLQQCFTLFDFYKFQEDMLLTPEKWLELSIKKKISEFWFTWQGMINFKKLTKLNIKFKKGLINEDQLFGFSLFGQINSIYVLNKSLLWYRIRSNSSMNYGQEKKYSSYLNGLSEGEINHIKKTFQYNIDIVNSYLDVVRKCNLYLSLFHIFKDTDIFSLLKEAFLNNYLEKSVEIFNFKNDPLKIKKEMSQQIDKIINNFYVEPIFSDNYISIVFSCDENYLIYLPVVLHSIKTQSQSNHQYDICILHDQLDLDKIDTILNFFKNDRFSLRFISIHENLKLLKKQICFYTTSFFTEAMYYRFFIPKIFCKYTKVIYLDIDIIVMKDLQYLNSITFEKPLAAVQCMIFSQDFIEQNDHRISVLKMKQPKNYFNSGILIYNIEECQKISFTEQCIQTLNVLKQLSLPDQDVLNCVADSNVFLLPLAWNFLWNVNYRKPNYKVLYSNNFLQEYKEAEKNPYIIHYCDFFKPWNSPHLPKADIWWHYARQTPFYEEILFKNITQNISHFNHNHANYTPQGAVEKVKTHLSYKLGKEILSIKENKLKVFVLPFILIFIYIKHKISNLMFKLILNSNPNLKSLPLNHYSDYQEALKIQNYLSYKLGNLLIKHPFTFVFRVASVYREWKEG
ncbi:glycosyltransferase [Campylobacter jejuni]|nr:glycosyltransferase [Campylobacter jejuni]